MTRLLAVVVHPGRAGLTQEARQMLLDRLGMVRKGRLDDFMDWQLGYRRLDDADSDARMEIWRQPASDPAGPSVDYGSGSVWQPCWTIVVTYTTGQPSSEQAERWRAEILAAAEAAGLRAVGDG